MQLILGLICIFLYAENAALVFVTAYCTIKGFKQGFIHRR